MTIISVRNRKLDALFIVFLYVHCRWCEPLFVCVLVRLALGALVLSVINGQNVSYPRFE